MPRLFLFLVISVLLTSCSVRDVPVPKVFANGKPVPLKFGASMWNKLAADGIPGPPNEEHKIIVPPKSSLVFKFDYQPKELVLYSKKKGLKEQKEIVKKNEVLLPKKEGIYYYHFYGKWKEGYLLYSFIIEVRPLDKMKGNSLDNAAALKKVATEYILAEYVGDLSTLRKITIKDARKAVDNGELNIFKGQKLKGILTIEIVNQTQKEAKSIITVSSITNKAESTTTYYEHLTMINIDGDWKVSKAQRDI